MRLPPPDQGNSGMHLTPLIDVVFLLLIFFLVATQFHQQERDASINLAEILKAQPLTSGPSEIVVNIARNGEYRINDRTLSERGLQALLERVSLKNPGMQSVQIRADREVQFQFPLTVIGICKRYDIAYKCTVLEAAA
jgi:biopolymer transport protein ExbD